MSSRRAKALPGGRTREGTYLGGGAKNYNYFKGTAGTRHLQPETQQSLSQRPDEWNHFTNLRPLTCAGVNEGVSPRSVGVATAHPVQNQFP